MESANFQDNFLNPIFRLVTLTTEDKQTCKIQALAELLPELNTSLRVSLCWEPFRFSSKTSMLLAERVASHSPATVENSVEWIQEHSREIVSTVVQICLSSFCDSIPFEEINWNESYIADILENHISASVEDMSFWGFSQDVTVERRVSECASKVMVGIEEALETILYRVVVTGWVDEEGKLMSKIKTPRFSGPVN